METLKEQGREPIYAAYEENEEMDEEKAEKKKMDKAEQMTAMAKFSNKGGMFSKDSCRDIYNAVKVDGVDLYE